MLRQKYVPALDGLRAIAVLLVVFNHNGWGVQGGHIGVDLFLVLSGFLITSVLLSEQERTGRISLLRFYWRRFLRLTPAFALLLATYAVVAFLWSGDWPGQSQAIIYAATYTMNWNMAGMWGPTGYLTHTWSLAIEEQFYLLWAPALVLLVRYCSRRTVVVLLVSLICSSVVWRAVLWMETGDYVRGYLGSDTRASGLLVGSLMALFGTKRLPGRLWFIPAAFLVYVADAVPVQDPFLQLGGGLLVSLASAWLIASAMNGNLPALAAKPLVAVGAVSYGLYLWHWPLLALLRQVDSHSPWIATLGAFAICSASYLLLEKPLLTLKEWRPKSPVTSPEARSQA